MKITILSDVHLGFARGSEREGDSYEALAEALEKSQDSDLILIAGDMFDSSNPPAENLALAEEILLPFLLGKGHVSIIREGLDKDIKKLKLVNPGGRPVIAIHGTHERRARDLLNPVQALEKAGFLVYLHCNGVVVEKDGESVCVQGMSGVPDQYSERVLEEWSPRPKENCYNILMIHQNLKGFMHEKVKNQLDPGKLNKGFDLYVCGHIHGAQESELGGSRMVMPGGMVVTQLTEDAGKALGFYQVDTRAGSSEFVQLESQRKIYFLEAGSREESEKGIRSLLEEKHSKKPIIRLKVKGDFPVRELKARFGNRAILSLKKDSGAGDDGGPEAGVMGLEEQRLSVSELGKKLLRENLERQGLSAEIFENVFELLLEKRTEKALELLRQGEKAETKPPEPTPKKKRPRKREEWEGRGELGKFLG